MTTNNGPTPFSTPRLDALPLRVDHADEMAAVLADPALHTFTGGAPQDAEALRSRYARQTAGSPDPAERWWNWVLRVRGDDCLAGYVQATVDVTGARAEIAWVIGTGCQGRGYAKEAAAGLVAHLLDGERCVRSSPTSTRTTRRPRRWPRLRGWCGPGSGRTARCGGGWRGDEGAS